MESGIKNQDREGVIQSLGRQSMREPRREVTWSDDYFSKTTLVGTAGRSGQRCVGDGTSGIGAPSNGKESSCNARDLGPIPVLGRSPGGGSGNALQYSCQENPHGQRSLVVNRPWNHKESDTEQQRTQCGPAGTTKVWKGHREEAGGIRAGGSHPNALEKGLGLGWGWEGSVTTFPAPSSVCFC